MLRHRLTLDTLMDLTPPQLLDCLREMQQELDGTIAFLHENEAARQDDAVLDELSSLLTLRKTLRGRAEELNDELTQQPIATVVTHTGALASLRWANNLLQPAF